MPRDAGVKLGALCLRYSEAIRFEALPNRIQQIHFFGSGEAFDLISQVAHWL